MSRNLPIFWLSFLNWGLNTYRVCTDLHCTQVRTYACTCVTTSSWRKERHVAFCVQAEWWDTDHEHSEAFRGTGAQWTHHVSGSHHKGKEDEYLCILISFGIIYILFSLDWRLPTCPGFWRIIVSHITFLLHREARRGEKKKSGKEKLTCLLE